MKRAAVIDLGSNAGRMAVFAYEPGRRFQQIDQLRETVRLASGPRGENIIRGEAFQQGVQMLAAFGSYCKVSDIEEVIPVATSAVRDAKNGDSFVAAVRERAGVGLEILSGDAEARYGVLAVANSHRFEDALVLDVGGGSAQLSLMEARTFVEGASWPIGGVRMTEAHIFKDPPKKRELDALEREVRGHLQDRLRDLPRGRPLVGMGGTIRNLARIQQARIAHPVSLLHGYRLQLATVRALAADLAAMTVEQRREVSGLNRDRADVIVAAAHVVRIVMELCEAPELTVSSHGLREGLLYTRMWPEEDGHLVPDVREFTVLNTARRYYDHPAHNEKVRDLALELFDGLAPWHGYGPEERGLLSAAGLLHDVGMAVDYFEHHTHGQYLVMAAPMPGFTHREQAMIALLVGAHRKGKPQPGPLAALLEPKDPERIAKLAGMLRLAEYLERTKAQVVRGVRCHLGDGYLQVEVLAAGTAEVEMQAANRRTDLLAKSFGVNVEVILGAFT